MDLIVSTEWLAQSLDDTDLVILDASAHLPAAGRDPASEYGTAHIPGARFLDLPTLKDETSPVPAALPRIDQFEARMSVLGVNQADRIVLYDDSPLRSSARAYFICRMFGLQHIAILDGGLAKWQADGFPVESGLPQLLPSDFRARQDDRRRVRSKSDVLANLAAPSEQIVDARDAARFSGSTPDLIHNLPGGHIPGSRNLPFTEMLRDDGTFKSPAELREAMSAASIDLSAPVTGSCGSGMTASVVLFAMELIGKYDTALFDGSWSEWGADPNTPKEQGPAR